MFIHNDAVLYYGKKYMFYLKTSYEAVAFCYDLVITM